MPYIAIHIQLNTGEYDCKPLIDCARHLLQPSMATSLFNLLGQHIGCSDAAWNMLSLSPQMHDW